MDFIVALIIGGAAGWLAGMIYRGGGLGILGNIILGIVGGFVGFWLLGKIGISLGEGWIGTILTSAIGAIIILFVINLFTRKK